MGGDPHVQASLVHLKQALALTPDTKRHQGSSAKRTQAFRCGSGQSDAVTSWPPQPCAFFSVRSSAVGARAGPSTEEAFNGGCRTEFGAKLDSHQHPRVNTACG